MEPLSMTHIAEAFASMTASEVVAIIVILVWVAFLGICKINPLPRKNKHVSY